MKYIEIIADAGNVDTIAAIADTAQAQDFRFEPPQEDGLQKMRLLVTDDKLQSALDDLQRILAAQEKSRIIVLPVDITLPELSKETRKQEDVAVTTREALYAEVEKNTHLNQSFVLLVILSTLVAAIGLIKDNVAVVIGAMVIAPLLGPNLALGLGTALGDVHLMSKSAITLAIGILLAVALSLVIGLFWPVDVISHELLLRTQVGMDSVALALVSGVAAALSLTTGLSTVLVGVMVAVALLPPAATLGIMAGYGEMQHAGDAGLQLAINIVSVNLAANVVFFVRGIRPRTWWSKEQAKRKTRIYLLVWVVILAILVLILFTRRTLIG